MGMVIDITIPKKPYIYKTVPKGPLNQTCVLEPLGSHFCSFLLQHFLHFLYGTKQGPQKQLTYWTMKGFSFMTVCFVKRS